MPVAEAIFSPNAILAVAGDSRAVNIYEKEIL
jgi:hypothetical protein